MRRDAAGRQVLDEGSGHEPEHPAEPDSFLAKLRREFPHWGILTETPIAPWVALRGPLELKASNGIDLREKLLAAAAAAAGRDGRWRGSRAL